MAPSKSRRWSRSFPALPGSSSRTPTRAPTAPFALKTGSCSRLVQRRAGALPSTRSSSQVRSTQARGTERKRRRRGGVRSENEQTRASGLYCNARRVGWFDLGGEQHALWGDDGKQGYRKQEARGRSTRHTSLKATRRRRCAQPETLVLVLDISVRVWLPFFLPAQQLWDYLPLPPIPKKETRLTCMHASVRPVFFSCLCSPVLCARARLFATAHFSLPPAWIGDDFFAPNRIK